MIDTDDGWNLRLFLFSPGGIIVLAFALLCSWVVWLFSDREILIAKLQIDESAVAHIYEDNFCDQARIPTFEVLVHGKAVSPKHSTLLWLECGQSFQPGSFRVVCVESESICGVFWDYGNGEALAFVYDQKQHATIPSTNTPAIPDRYEALLMREAADTR